MAKYFDKNIILINKKKTMEFKKYQHLERFGTTEVNGIEDGMCYIFPKIDGTNSSVWFNDGLQAGSRKRHLTLESDNFVYPPILLKSF